ncbi:MAG: SDR family oxidoreductase, partial [Thermodesulfobacteria bacterium]|nr:SDR family oxidoreductase [Thermodesulfobacteriota bacterium]
AAAVFNDCYSLANRSIGLLTRQWARMGAPNVRVNELMLGFFETRHGPGTRGWSVMSEEEKQALISHTLLKRVGTLEDACKAVDFLCFGAPFMTGARIVLDGGYILGGEDVPDMPQGVVQPGESVFGGSRPPETDKS